MLHVTALFHELQEYKEKQCTFFKLCILQLRCYLMNALQVQHSKWTSYVVFRETNHFVYSRRFSKCTWDSKVIRCWWQTDRWQSEGLLSNHRVITISFNNKFQNLDGVKLYNCKYWEGNWLSNSPSKPQLFLIFQMNLLNFFFFFFWLSLRNISEIFIFLIILFAVVSEVIRKMLTVFSHICTSYEYGIIELPRSEKPSKIT